MTVGVQPIPASQPECVVTLLYVRGAADGDIELHDRLQAVAARYLPHVSLRCLSAEEVRALTGTTPEVSKLIVLRRGEVISEAMGTLLPLREIDRVVRRAIEWT